MEKYKLPRGFILILVIVLGLLIGGSTRFFFAQRDQMQKDIENDLLITAESKVSQITQWRRDQIAEGRELISSDFFLRGVAAWMLNRDAQNEAMILSRFQSIQDHYGYFDVLLVNPQGKPLLSLSRDLSGLDSKAMETLTDALESGDALITDFHVGPRDPHTHISVIAPIISDTNGNKQPIGAVVLINDAQNYLYPLIQTWPTSSETAETLLVEKDGDDVLFLNDLRHQKDAALKLRISLSQTNLPAAKAILGQTGIATGEDYRGVEVLSALMPVPDSPWFMISKIDTSEALAVWRTDGALIFALLLGLIGSTAGLAVVYWQRGEKRHYFRMAAANSALHQSRERHRVTLMSVGDGVIVTNRQGLVELMNPVAETLTGWRLTEGQGQPLGKIFRILNEDTHKAVEDPVAKVVKKGMTVGLANHTLLIGRDGSEHPIADSGAPIKNEQGKITGVVLVFRDQTDERAAQRRLEASEEKFRRYFEDASIGISLTETNGKLTNINQRFCDMLGYSSKELSTKNFVEVTYPDDIPASKECVRCLLAGEQSSYRWEKRYIRKDGSILWADVSTTLLRDTEGKPLHFITSIVDITKRKTTEQALEENRIFIARVLDNLPVGVAVNSIFPEVSFSYVNENFLKLYRINRNAISAPNSFWEAAYEDPAERKDIKGRVLKDCESGDPQKMVWKDIPITRQGQETTYVSARNIPLPESNQMISTVWDTTSRKKTEAQIRHSQEMLQKAQQVAHVGSWIWHIKTNRLEWSDEMFKIFGIDKAEFSGSLADVMTAAIHPDDRAKVEASNTSVVEAKKPVPLEYRVMRPDGTICVVWAEAGELALDEDGHPERLSGIVQDITEYKKAEEEILILNAELEQRVEDRTQQLKTAQEKLLVQERLAILGKLAGGVSHELRNPLGVISNSIYLLVKFLPQADDKVKKYLSIISDETQRAEKIIADLLGFSRRKMPDFEKINMNELIEKTLERYQPPDFITVVNKLPKAPLLVFADAAQISQVFGNLFINAYQAMPEGGTLTLSGRLRKKDRKNYAAFEVQDTGSGISLENMEKMFEPLFTTKQRGIGLGLPTSKNLVESNGGMIEVRSEEGKGAIFSVYLPTAKGST